MLTDARSVYYVGLGIWGGVSNIYIGGANAVHIIHIDILNMRRHGAIYYMA